MKRHVILGYIAAAIIAAAGVGMLATHAVKAQGLTDNERDAIIGELDQNSAEAWDAIAQTVSARITDPAERRAMLDEIKTRLGLDFATSDREDSEELGRLKTALRPFRGVAGTQLEGMDSTQIFNLLTGMIELVPQSAE